MIPAVQPGSIAPYFQRYIDRVESEDVLGTLAELLTKTVTLFEGMTDEQRRHRYAEGKWSVMEVLGHILDTERVFVTRALVCARGDKTDWPGFEEDDYVAAANFDDHDPQHLLEELQAQRQATLLFFEGLSPEQLASRGMANGLEFHAGAIAWLLAGHHVHHLGVIRERYLGA